jgi:phage terminase small subunit
MPSLTPQQAAFIESYVECGSAVKAMKAAGYSPDRSNGQKLVRKFAEQISSAFQQTMASKAGVALNVLQTIMTDKEAAPRDRLRAASEWLDRAGNLSKHSSVSAKIVQQAESWTDDEGNLLMGSGGVATFMLPPKAVIDDDDS